PDAAWVGRMLQEVEEDAFARKSAGLSVVNKRTEKPRNMDGSKLDEEDREAARALRGKKKKVRKKAAVPFLERKWVKAAGILLVPGGDRGRGAPRAPPAAGHQAGRRRRDRRYPRRQAGGGHEVPGEVRLAGRRADG